MLTTPVNSGTVKQVIYPNNVRGDVKKEPILNFSDYDLCPKLINYLSPMINGVRMFDVIRTLYIVNMIVASILSILILVLKCILFTMKLRLGIHLL